MSAESTPPTSLEQLIDELDAATKGREEVSLGAIPDVVGGWAGFSTCRHVNGWMHTGA